MEKQQKKQVKKYISWVLIVTIVALLAFLPMIAARKEPETGPQASVLSTKAELRSISTAILGGGTLTAEEAVEITIPAAVKVTEYLVGNGSIVTQGQPVASVDRVSIMTAITQVQETLEHLQEQIDNEENETAPDTVTATAAGTVKIIYGEKGENVQDVILRDGALAVLSLDGLMAVQIERATDLSGGDAVCVTLSDGSEIDGRVESNMEGILTVTVEDNGFAVGETVKVTTADGDRIGSGALYIHSQWNVLAYSGTISKVRVNEGDTVKAGNTLFVLEDTGHTAEFDTLARQHREYEMLMLELFKMYQSETVAAPSSGMVTGVDENGAYMLASGDTGRAVSLLANAPNGNDETSYINYVGQVAQVGIDGLVMKMNPQAISITDYKDLSSVPRDTSLMTKDAIYSANAPVYELSGSEWIQISTSSIMAGDILLFAGDSAGNFVWVVRIARGTLPDVPDATEPADPTSPADPDAPSEPSDPTVPTTPTDPSTSRKPSQQGGGNMPSMGGGKAQEDTFELYALDTVTIAAVTAQEQMTIQITVDELDISKIHAGQSATVTVDALSGERFNGSITNVSSSGTNEGGNSKFTVDVTVSKTADMLPGMTAFVSITLTSTESMTCIPVAALTETGTETIVYTGYDEELGEFITPVAVECGVSDGEYVQILSGIDESETIYYPYYDTLVISNAPESGSRFPFK